MRARHEEFGEAELLKLLPKDHINDPSGERLAVLLQRAARDRVPVSSFARTWTLGTLQARVAAGYLVWWMRSRLIKDSAAKQRLRSEAHLSAALRLLGTMGYLRGAVMKVGQMLANLPEVLPEEFGEVLSSLHSEAPPMHFSLIREVFLDEFGREPEEVFAVFEQRACAAATLGQVHRARLHSGEEVAVKIQYPGIARTITSDMRSLRLLLQPLSLSPEWENALAKLTDVEQMLLRETDYLKEANFNREARKLFGPEDRIVVPRVYDDYCSSRVLTTDYLEGCHLKQYLTGHPDQRERDHFTHLITVATFRLFFERHWLTADPNPGNFIFMPDGRLGLIDFGCTRAMDSDEWELAYEPMLAVLADDRARVDRAIARGCLYNDPREMSRDQIQTVRKSLYWLMEPWLADGLFDFGNRDFFMRGIDSIMTLTRKGYTRSVPLTLWSQRFTLVGRALCYNLKGRCEFRRIYDEECARHAALS
jgi:predicted unusual protein kinase regulating ubiquinone biosynthesis (AarF/ABC1/UbiB family)